MRFAITLLVALLAHEAHAGCESTRWIDDFSAGVPTHESVSPVEGSSATAVAHEELPNGDTRASFVASWQMQPPQIPSVISRVVMERGSTAPLTCWSGSNLIGAQRVGWGGFCDLQWYNFGATNTWQPLNGATQLVVVTDHIGVDGQMRLHVDGYGSPTIQMGYRSKSTVWTTPLRTEVIAAGQFALVDWEWHAEDEQGRRIPHARVGVLRIGLSGPDVCLPTPPPTPGPYSPRGPYGALQEDGDRIVGVETWQGNGRTCTTCHVPEDGTRLSLVSSVRDPLDRLYWPLLGEDPSVIQAEAKVLAHPRGFDMPAELLPVPRLLGLTQYGLTPRSKTFGHLGAVDDLDLMNRNAVTDHLAFTDARVPGVDFRQPSLWEMRALTEHIRRAR